MPLGHLSSEDLLLPSELMPSLKKLGMRILVGGEPFKHPFGHYYDPEYVKFFHPDQPSDVPYSLERDDFADILARLPAGWRPDLVLILYPEYSPIPAGLEACPVPIVGLVGDWNLGLRDLLPCLGLFDQLICDAAGVELFRALGLPNAHYWPAYSFDSDLHHPGTEEKSHDITFIGNLNHYVQRDRSRFLKLVAGLADEYRVHILTGIHGAEYARCLQRSKIVFNRSIRGELNLRCYEAPACGAMVFIEDSNRESRVLLRDGLEAVYYTEEDLQAKLQHYLTHDAEREAITHAGAERVRGSSYTAHFSALLRLLRPLVDAPIPERPFARLPKSERLHRLGRLAYRSTGPYAFSHAERMLLAALEHAPDDPAIIADLAATYAAAADATTDPTLAERLRIQARAQFDQALAGAPDLPVLCLNAAFFMRGLALQRVRELLEQVISTTSHQWEGVLYPSQYGHLQVELETILAAHAGNPQETSRQWGALVRWQAAEWLGDLEADPEERHRWYRLAVKLRPDMGRTQTKLGMSLSAAGDDRGALECYRRSLEDNPFDMATVKEAIRALAALGDHLQVQALYEEYRPVLKAVAQLGQERAGLEETYLEAVLGRLAGVPADRTLLIGGTVRQKPAILMEFLASLERLEPPEGYARAFIFIDDNEDPLSRQLLSEWVASRPADSPGAILYRHDAEPYQRDQETHYWTSGLIWKVGAYKDEIFRIALDRGYHSVMLIDSDLILHPLTLRQLVSRGVDIISNLFWTEWLPGTPEQPNVWIQDVYNFYRQHSHILDEPLAEQESQAFLERLRIPGCYEVGGLGACTLISRRALEAGVSYRQIPNVSFWGEDRHFCVRAHVLGLRLWVETTLPCFHLYRDTDLQRIPEHLQPPQQPAVFAIEGLRTANYLLFVEPEDDAWRHGLMDYLRHVAPDRDITLLVYSAQLSSETLLGLLEAAMEEAGKLPEELPDLLIIEQRLPRGRERELFGLADGAYHALSPLRRLEAEQIGCRLIGSFREI